MRISQIYADPYGSGLILSGSGLAIALNAGILKLFYQKSDVKFVCRTAGTLRRFLKLVGSSLFLNFVNPDLIKHNCLQ
jgi:hypothetical protein